MVQAPMQEAITPSPLPVFVYVPVKEDGNKENIKAMKTWGYDPPSPNLLEIIEQPITECSCLQGDPLCPCIL